MTTTFTYSDELISDFHKEAYGFRPSVDFFARWDEMSQDQKQEEWDYLCQMVRDRAAEEKLRYQQAVEQFEVRILESIRMGAATREDAIRWILQAEGFDKEYDAGYICYCLGLPYSRKAEFKPFVSWDYVPHNEEY